MADQQLPLLEEQNDSLSTETQEEKLNEKTAEDKQKKEDEAVEIKGEWQANNVAGSFILYAMLNKSHFLDPFVKHLKGMVKTGSKSVERVMLTLFFMHALRLKNIEQTKHLLSAHFGPLVLGAFCRVQNLRYAIDDITNLKQFAYRT